MPLSTVLSGRTPIHTRSIECRSFSRPDGLWDIEGHLTDIKSYPFFNEFRGAIKPGVPLHDMWIRLTIDRNFVIKEIEAITDGAPYEVCPAILPSFQKLKGLKIGPGWNKRTKEILGKSKGCAHLVDMLKPIATVAFHTVKWSSQASESKENHSFEHSKPPINSCHVWAAGGEKIRTEYPSYYSKK